jgi:hypothetical protein
VVWRPPSPTYSKLSQQGSSELYVRCREAGCRARVIEIAGRVIELRKLTILRYKTAHKAQNLSPLVFEGSASNLVRQPQMIKFLKSAEEPDAGNLLVRICGGLGRESAGPTQNRTLIHPTVRMEVVFILFT